MSMARPFVIALVSGALLGWMAPVGQAAPCAAQETVEAHCPLQEAMPCCARREAPAPPAPSDSSCAIRCAQLQTAAGLAPVPVFHQADAPCVPPLMVLAAQPRSVMTAARLVRLTHAPPRRYAFLCIYRC